MPPEEEEEQRVSVAGVDAGRGGTRRRRTYVALAVVSVLLLATMTFFLFRYRVSESFTSPMGRADYMIMGDLIKVFDQEMRSLREDWYMCCGNVLGYCRHGGTIPWDDDFDVCVSERAFKELTENLLDSLVERGYGVYTVRPGLAKLFSLERGKNIESRELHARWPFIDIFSYSIVEEGGGQRDVKGRLCRPGQIFMTKATRPRCVPRETIFPTRRVKYTIPYFGELRLPIPNKPGEMVAMIYGAGALLLCSGRSYDHMFESSSLFGGHLVDCADLSKNAGVVLQNNCPVTAEMLRLSEENDDDGEDGSEQEGDEGAGANTNVPTTPHILELRK